MNSVKITKNFGITGTATGTASNPYLSSRINAQNVTTANQAGSAGALVNQVYDVASGTLTTTVAPSATTTLNLNSGLTDPLGGSLVFGKIKSIYIEHTSASTASSIKVFAAGTNPFQGPLSAGAYFTLAPGESIYLQSYTSSGWAVSGTVKNISILNNSGTNSAIFRVYVDGTT